MHWRSCPSSVRLLIGELSLGKSASRAESDMTRLLKDTQSAIRVSSAQALFTLGQKEKAIAALMAELNEHNNEYAQQNAINAITQINALPHIPNSWIKATQRNKNAGNYLKRLAAKLAKERKK